MWVLSGGLRVSVVGAGCGGFARGVRPFRPGSFFYLGLFRGSRLERPLPPEPPAPAARPPGTVLVNLLPW